MKRSLDWRAMRKIRMRQIKARGKGVWSRMAQAVGSELGRGTKVAVGISGGADSVVLAEAILRSGGEPILLHFNHRWRGRVGDRDALWVKAWGKRRGLRVVVGRAHKPGRTGEGEARELRWDFFRKAMRRIGVKQLWLAQQADDQAETVLMQLLRGAGVDGMAGMTVRSKLSGVDVVRPLLGFTRKEVRDAAREEGLSWREDKTNEDEKGWRSRVRHKVLPYLSKAYGREVRGALCRAAEIFAGEKEYWEKELGRVSTRPDVREWRKKDVAWQRRAIRMWLGMRNHRGATFAEVEGVRKYVVMGKSSGWQFKGGRVVRSKNKLFWIKEMGRIAHAGQS